MVSFEKMRGWMRGGTASSVTVDLSFDTEGGVLLSSSVMVALAYAGLALGGGIQPIGMLATNCPTVCHLLRFALMIIVNLTVGVGAKFGIAFMYWSSPPWHGFGWSMTLTAFGATTLLPVNLHGGVFVDYTSRLSGANCRGEEACAA
jgi:hypothetical protein